MVLASPPCQMSWPQGSTTLESLASSLWWHAGGASTWHSPEVCVTAPMCSATPHSSLCSWQSGPLQLLGIPEEVFESKGAGAVTRVTPDILTPQPA